MVVRARCTNECCATERDEAGREVSVLRLVEHKLTALSESCSLCVLDWLRAALACRAMVTVAAAGCKAYVAFRRTMLASMWCA